MGGEIAKAVTFAVVHRFFPGLRSSAREAGTQKAEIQECTAHGMILAPWAVHSSCFSHFRDVSEKYLSDILLVPSQKRVISEKCHEIKEKEAS